MHTQCPHCQTIFSVTADHLNIAQGDVRCGNCQNIFNATNFLQRQFPEASVSEPFDTNDKEDFIIGTENDDIPDMLQYKDVDEPRSRSWGTLFFWGIMIVLLSATLVGQIMWFWQHDSILQNPQVRPWLEEFCEIFLCTLPATRDLNSLQMQEHVVHVNSIETIQFDITFINNATFPQPYPDLQLTPKNGN